MMDDKLIAARETLRAKGNEVVSALLAIFKDNTDDHYRAAIVDALQHNNGDKAVASNFLAQQLDVGVAQWQGEIWISSAIKFLAVFDPVQARKISRNALDAKSSFVKQAALSTLSAVGNSEDIPFLQNFLARQRLLIQAEANNELVKKGDDAVKTISHRQSAEKNSN